MKEADAEKLTHLRSIVDRFDISSFFSHPLAEPPSLINITVHKSGHINDTYRSEWNVGGKQVHFIHQRVNHYVFPDVPKVMSNIEKVTRHVRSKLEEEKRRTDESAQRVLQVIPAKDGKSYLVDGNGDFWRTYDYIEDTYSIDYCQSAQEAQEAARTFGQFLSYLSDLSLEGMHETIPFFQNTPKRFAALREAIARDGKGRKASAQDEIQFALDREAFGSTITASLENGAIPYRVTHNDLKVNNVLFGVNSHRGLCVVDLDTCMPGSALFDFGDMVRSMSVPAAEDEQDLSKVFMDEATFEALVSGFLQGAGTYFTPPEMDLLPIAPRILALTLGVRFLSDYLDGDAYFKTSRPTQNLDRARAQFQIVRSMEGQEAQMRQIVQKSVL